MPPQVTLPRSAAIQRGDAWSQKVVFNVDVSAFEFSIVFAHSRYDTESISGTIDVTHAGDPDNYIYLNLDAETTAEITANLLKGELQAGPERTLFALVVPVTGQINTTP